MTEKQQQNETLQQPVVARRENWPDFNEVKDPDIRTWNRCSIFFNIVGEEGVLQGQKYASQFDSEEKNRMLGIYSRIGLEGYDAVRASVNKGGLNARS